MMVGAGREVAGKEERAVDITDISDKQTEIDNDIKNKWGNPSSPTLLSGDITASNLSTSGDAWYYLNSDITANFSRFATTGNLRIVLNGYSISGSFGLACDSNFNAGTLSIFDKIPGKSGTGYTYNSNPVKYYKYNSSLGKYSDYSTTAPSGTDVTNMPTWKADTYIKVTGSAISPNSKNNRCSTYLGHGDNGIFNMYGINVVGVIGAVNIVYANSSRDTNLYQCNIIGNQSSYYGALGYYRHGSGAMGTLTIEGCKVYGNQSYHTYSAVELSNSDISGKMYDFAVLNASGNINIYKCNIGVIGNHNCEKALNMKDVSFGNTTVTLKENTLTSFFAGTNNISGTIELIYSNTTNYTGNSPNLNFLVHGNDSDSTPKKGKNNLTVNGTCGNITTVFDDTTVVNPITINGTCSGISTRGNVTIGSSGKVSIQQGQIIGGTITNNGNFIIPEGVSYTIPTGKNVGGIVTNNGTLTIDGGVTNLTNNGKLIIPQGKSHTVASGQTLGGNVTNQGTLTIDSGATATSSIENVGTLNVTGTVSNVYGYGSINVNANGNVTKKYNIFNSYFYFLHKILVFIAKIWYNTIEFIYFK